MIYVGDELYSLIGSFGSDTLSNLDSVFFFYFVQAIFLFLFLFVLSKSSQHNLSVVFKCLNGVGISIDHVPDLSAITYNTETSDI